MAREGSSSWRARARIRLRGNLGREPTGILPIVREPIAWLRRLPGHGLCVLPSGHLGPHRWRGQRTGVGRRRRPSGRVSGLPGMGRSRLAGHPGGAGGSCGRRSRSDRVHPPGPGRPAGRRPGRARRHRGRRPPAPPRARRHRGRPVSSRSAGRGRAVAGRRRPPRFADGRPRPALPGHPGPARR